MAPLQLALFLLVATSVNICRSEPLTCRDWENNHSTNKCDTPPTCECYHANISSFDQIPANNWTTIDISYNLISSIKEHQFNGSYWRETLTSLTIENCNITSIDGHAFNDLTILEILSLKNNQLQKTINATAFEIPTLTELNLQNCNISELPVNLFDSLKNLRVLFLSQNKIAIILDRLFTPMISINKIFLDRNKIENITNEMFNGLVNLTTILLSDNEIKYIGETAFIFQVNLQKFTLQDNNLTSLHLETVKPLLKNSEKFNEENSLFLSGNPWDCCELFPIFEYCQNITNNCSVGISVTCDEPMKYKEKTFKREDFNELRDVCFPQTTTTTTTTTITQLDTTVHEEPPEIPEVTTETPEQSPGITDAPTIADNSTEMSEQTTEMPEQTTKMPEQTTEIPELRNCSSDNGNGTFSSWGCSRRDGSGNSRMDGTGGKGGMCEYQYYFLGGYAIFVLLVACTVWIIMCRVRKSELNEHLHFE